MTLQRARSLASRWSRGCLCSLRHVEAEEYHKLFLALLEEEPLLDEEGLELLRFLKEQYFCTWFDGLRLLIPAGAGMRIQKALALTDRPAASPDEAQAALLAWLKKRGGRAYPALVGFICLETDSTIPISANWIERAVPP